MPCYMPEPNMDTLEYIERMLCATCKFLTRKQLLEIKVSPDYIDLLEWYAGHLVNDYSKTPKDDLKKREDYKKELNRIGCFISNETEGSFTLHFHQPKGDNNGKSE